MFPKGMRFIIFVLFATVLTSCGSGGDGVSGTSPGTGLVYISLGGGVQSSGMVSSSAIAGLPSDITDIIVTCTADGISPITGSLPLDGSSLALEVPAGANRVFTADAYAGSILRMTGSATVSYIYAGSQTTVVITLTDVATLTLTPATVSVETNAVQQFTATVTGHADTTVTWSVNGVDGGNATAGTVSTSGFYTAPANVPTPATVTVRATSNAAPTLVGAATVTVSTSTVPVAVTVSPSTVSLGALQVQTFSAVVTGTTNSAVTWSVEDVSCGADMGSINGSGDYTAGNPATTCQATVRATSDADPTKSDTATITVVVINVAVSPSTATVATGGTQQFTAMVTGTTNSAVIWSIDSSTCSNPGAITTDGMYTAGTSTDDCSETVRATSQADTTKSDTAFVTVDAPVVVTVTGPSNVDVGTTDAFTATVTGTTNSAVTWYVNDIAGGNSTVGTIDTSGIYTAPASVPNPATVTVKAVSNTDGVSFGTAQATVEIPTCLGGSITVDSTTDAADVSIGDGICDDGTGACTLRAAIQETNACAGADIITLPAGTYILAIAGTGEDAAATGDLDITDDLTITGAGAASTIIDGGAIDRVLHAQSAAVTIDAATIRNGRLISVTCYDACGAGIFSIGGSLTITGSAIDSNVATGSNVGNAGGIYCFSCTLSITNSTISNNTASGPSWSVGGGILKTGGGTTTITNTTISGNSAGYYGGGFSVNGTVSTFTNVTITDNSASGGAGLYARNSGTQVTLINSIVANQTGGGDCYTFNGASPVNALGDSIDSDGTCGLATTANPLFNALADNGGPTQTHALLAGSPAIDAGDNASCPAADQRGFNRFDGLCDIGAYEAMLLHQLSVTLTGTGSGSVTSSPGKIKCPGTCSDQIGENTVVTLTATPDANSAFSGWFGDADCSDGQVTMVADTSCTATFTPVQ